MKKLPKYKLNRNLFSCYSCNIVQLNDGNYIKVEDLTIRLQEIVVEMSKCKTVQECTNILTTMIDKEKTS